MANWKNRSIDTFLLKTIKENLVDTDEFNNETNVINYIIRKYLEDRGFIKKQHNLTDFQDNSSGDGEQVAPTAS